MNLSNQPAVPHNGALALDAAGDAGGAALLRNVVHYHQARSGIRPAGTRLQSIMPHGWYEGPLPHSRRHSTPPSPS